MDGDIAWGTPRGRGVLVATVLASGVAFLDSTIVNVALPTIGRSLGADLAGLQWTLDAYLLALTAFLLPAGALADRVGRRRVFLAGLVAFALSSALCALAWDAASLAVARGVQGLAGALLVPGSLAVLRASFREADVPRAVGAWAGLASVAAAAGPFVGGWLAQAVSWRAIFLVNAPLAAAALVAAYRCVPESRDPARSGVDLLGGALAAAGLGGVVFALIERGVGHPVRVAAAGAGVAALAAFVAVEARRRDAMLPLGLFTDRAFSALNAVTLALYFALGGAVFLAVLQLQVGVGWSPLAAGAALGPLTLLLLVLSPLSARAAGRLGARPLLAGGALCCGAGLLLLGRVAPGARFVPDVLPGVTALGLGLGLAVAPLTSAVLEAAPPARAGIASAVNNAVARLAGLLAVAVLPAAGGIAPGDGLAGGLGAGYRRAMSLAAAVAVLGAGIAAAALPRVARGPQGQKTRARPPGAGTISTALRPRSDLTR